MDGILGYGWTGFCLPVDPLMVDIVGFLPDGLFGYSGPAARIGTFIIFGIAPGKDQFKLVQSASVFAFAFERISVLVPSDNALMRSHSLPPWFLGSC